MTTQFQNVGKWHGDPRYDLQRLGPQLDKRFSASDVAEMAAMLAEWRPAMNRRPVHIEIMSLALWTDSPLVDATRWAIRMFEAFETLELA